MLLVACGAVSEGTSSQTSTEQEMSSVVVPAASNAVSEPAAVTPHEACSPPGSERDCCPFPQGCSCLGVQFCKSTGQWGVCQGAGAAGQPCP